MRLQDDGVPLDRTPAAGMSVAQFHKVNRPLELRAPCSFGYFVLGLVHLHETAWWKDGIHGEILRSNVPVGKLIVGKQLKISHGHGAPLLDGTPQICRFLERESWIEPGRHSHLCDIAQSFREVRLLRPRRANIG